MYEVTKLIQPLDMSRLKIHTRIIFIVKRPHSAVVQVWPTISVRNNAT